MIDNKQQSLILESQSKRIVVLACPGSGKTTTLTKKIIGLYKSGVSLKRILSVTFTRKAAQEMFERISKEIPVSRSEQRNICTLHSLGCRLLYIYKDLVGLKEDYSVAVKSEKVEIINEIFGEDHISEEKISSFLSFVSSIKNGFILNEGNYSMEQFDSYASKMIDRNLIDIDDYIYLPVKILRDNLDVRVKISNRYDYIYVDEYQDINKIQNDFLDLLINENTHVLYVGDDDQSIYEFRGSNPNYILEKSSESSDFDVYFLTTNYRSQKSIVELSKKVLSSLTTQNRREKTILANKSTSSVRPVRNRPFSSKEDEINYVVNEIYRLITQTFVEPKEIAVLCRYSSRKYSTGIPHPELLEIGNRLKAKGIDASMSLPMEGDVKTSKQIKELCNYLNKLSLDSFEPSLLNLVRPNAFKKERFLEIVELINQQCGTSLDANEYFPDLLNKITAMDIQLESPGMQRRLKTIIDAFNFTYEQFRSVHCNGMPSEIISSLLAYHLDEDSIQDSDKEIYEYAILFSKSAEGEFEGEENSKYGEIVKAMEAFLYEQDKTSSKNCVRLLTAHQSKGLQFDVVFVVGLEAGSFPSNRELLDDQNLDNERRLFYVCITRARELLYLSSTGYATENTKDLADKSFIYNLPADYFDDCINSFDSVTFTYDESDSMSRRIKASEKIIDQLESEQYQMITELKNAKSTIKLLEEKNREISSNDSEYRKNLLKIQALQKNVNILVEELEGKDTYLDVLKDRIENLDKEKERLEAEILKYKNNDIYKEKYDELFLKLSRNEEARAELLREHNSLIQKLEAKDKENLLLRQKIKEITERQRLESETDRISASVNTTIDKVNKSKIEFVYDGIFAFPDNIVSNDVKAILKKLFKVFVIDKKYPKIAPRFETGLSHFQDYMQACNEFLNGKSDKDVFVSRLNSASYKTSLFSLIRGIMAVQSNSVNVLKNGKEFGIYPFLKEIISQTYPNNAYGKLAKNYVVNSARDRTRLTKELAERMKISYVVGNVTNHGINSNDGDQCIAEYQSIVKDFLKTPSTKYYSVFSAFFEFIALHIDNDLLMLHVKDL